MKMLVRARLRGKLPLLLLIGVLMVGLFGASIPAAEAATITQWTFDTPPTPPAPPAPDTGTGTAAAGAGLAGEAYFADNSTGSAWSFSGWTTGTAPASDDYFQFAVDTTGYENIVLTFEERRSGTGVRGFDVLFSTDGGGLFLTATTVVVPDDTAWRFHTVDMSANTMLDNNPNVVFRIAGYSAEASGGTWRIDDVTISGDALAVVNPVINEFTSKGTEWVEIYNPSGSSVDLTGWYLADVACGTPATTITTNLAAGGYFVVNSGDTGDNFSLDNVGDFLVLCDATHAEIDRVSYGTVGAAPIAPFATGAAQYSTARVTDGADTDNDALDWNIDPSPTSGTANDVAGVNLGGAGVVINEIDVFPAVGNDLIELYNETGAPIDVSGWFISDGDDVAVLNGGLSVPANGFLVIEETVDWTTEGSTGADFASTDVFYLFDTSRVRVDQIGWAGEFEDGCFARLPDGAGVHVGYDWTSSDGGNTWVDQACTMGATNVLVDTPPTVTSTVPANNATGVLLTANIDVTFSEPVTLTNPAFTLTCTSGGRNVTVTGGPTTFTLNPDTDFAPGDVCTVNVLAARVADQDGTADNMAADYSFSFTVAAPVAAIIPPYSTDFTTCLPTGWATFSVDADTGNTWYCASFSGNGFAAVNGFGDTAAANDWLISPPFDLTALTNEILTFDTWTRYTDAGQAYPQVSLLYSTTYTGGDPSLATWTPLAYTPSPQDSQTWTASGAVDIGGIVGTDVYFAFQYLASGTGGGSSTLWEVDNFAITQDVPPQVTSAAPVGATGLTPDVNLSFDEPVAVTGTWLSISCTLSGNYTNADFTTITASPSATYTLSGGPTFTDGETCTVTLVAASITDVDGTPHNLDGNGDGTGGDDYQFIFNPAAGATCATVDTPIYTVQGNGATSPLVGSSQTVQGVVTGIFPAWSPAGFTIQEITGDGLPATSDGIYIEGATTASVGDVVEVTGTVEEQFGQTQIQATAVNDCTTTDTITPTVITLPITDWSEYERYEGMLVTFQAASGDLTVNDTYNLGRYGEFELASGGRIANFTQVNAPDATAYAAYQEAIEDRIILVDDAINAQNPDPAYTINGAELSATNPLRAGFTVNSATGVLAYGYSEYRLFPTQPINFINTNARTPAPFVVGDVEIASFNVLNYFDAPFPTSRGADTPAEFDRQSEKIVAALTAMDADVVGLMEIENNTTAIDELVTRLNTVAGAGTYADINVGVVGTDEIKVDMIYQPFVVSPIGAPAVLDSNAFVDPNNTGTPKNRPAIAQAFQVNATGDVFVVVVVHLKSKGSGCGAGDDDTTTGQGNCNLTRTMAADYLVNTWIPTSPTGVSTLNYVLVGDFNAYAMEDPISTVENANYTNTAIQFNGGSLPYSYGFPHDRNADPEVQTWGTLDYIFVSQNLNDNLAYAFPSAVSIWHINTDEPTVFDYNLEFKSANHQTTMYAPNPYRSSDHDPVVIGLDFPLILDVDAAITKTVDNALPNEGDTVVFTLELSSLETNDVTDPVVIDTLPTGLTYVSDTCPGTSSTAPVTGGTQITCDMTGTTLTQGSPISFTITATVDAGTSGQTLTNDAYIDPGSTQSDLNNDNNQAQAAVCVDATVCEPVTTPEPGDTPTPVPGEPGQPGQPGIGVFDPAISKIGYLVPGQTGVTGEQLEWIVTVSNSGSVAGTNVIVTDTIIPELQINDVETPAGVTAVIANQDVIVTIPVLNPGQTITFSIFTTTLQGASVSNTVCLVADGFATPRCATGTGLRALPATGESPIWRIPALIAALLLAIAGGWIAIRRRVTA